MPDHRKGEQRDRLKNALRENLKRRKAQAKGRAAVSRVDGDEGHGSGDRPDSVANEADGSNARD